MKKVKMLTVISVVLATAALSACGGKSAPDAERYHALVKANSFEQLSLRHDSVFLDREMHFSDGSTTFEKHYADANVYYIANEYYGYSALKGSDRYFEYLWDSDDPTYYLYDSPDYYAEQLSEQRSVFPLAEDESEVLEATEKDGERFIAYTTIADQDLLKSLYPTDGSGAFTYEEGMSIRYKYVFDLNTEDLLEIEGTVVYPDGKECVCTKDCFSYEVEPESVDDILANYYDTTGNTRTITVTYFSGSDDEYSVEYETAKRAYFRIFVNGEIPEEKFSDPECTRPYQSGDGTEDIAIYLK